MGNLRYCENRRAEAIMCAIGATKWYNPSTSIDKEGTLVKGYPLAFLNEFCEIIGSANFFSSYPTAAFEDDLREYYEKSQATEELAPLGSLLPVGNHVAMREEHFDKMKEHLTIKGWVIEQSGVVRIPEAGVIRTDKH